VVASHLFGVSVPEFDFFWGVLDHAAGVVDFVLPLPSDFGEECGFFEWDGCIWSWGVDVGGCFDFE